MSKGVLQPDGTVCHKGAGCKRHGAPSGSSFVLPDVAPLRDEVAVSASSFAGHSRPPVIVDSPRFSFPESLVWDNGVIAEGNWSNPGCGGCEEPMDDYCRCKTFDDVWAEVDVRRVVADTLKCSVDDVPDEACAAAVEAGLDSRQNYTVTWSHDYYGDELDAPTMAYGVEEQVLESLQIWALDCDNLTDKDGVYNYVRAKGTRTKGLTPLGALKAQLAEENPGVRSDRVDRAIRVERVSLTVDDIVVPNKRHWDAVEARDVKSSVEASEAIAGVVSVKASDYNREHVLVDGYHRNKFLKQSSSSKRFPFFVFVEP